MPWIDIDLLHVGSPGPWHPKAPEPLPRPRSSHLAAKKGALAQSLMVDHPFSQKKKKTANLDSFFL